MEARGEEDHVQGSVAERRAVQRYDDDETTPLVAASAAIVLFVLLLDSLMRWLG